MSYSGDSASQPVVATHHLRTLIQGVWGRLGILHRFQGFQVAHTLQVPDHRLNWVQHPGASMCGFKIQLRTPAT